MAQVEILWSYGSLCFCALLRTGLFQDHGRASRCVFTWALLICKVRQFNHKQFRQLSFSSAALWTMFSFMSCGIGMNVISSGDSGEKFKEYLLITSYVLPCYHDMKVQNQRFFNIRICPMRSSKENKWSKETSSGDQILQKICPFITYKILSGRFGSYQCLVKMGILSSHKYTW